jgi:hypothetical protein
MGNDTRNDKDQPCYMDYGMQLFPEAIEGGQALDFTDPQTRDQALMKHFVREGERQGYKPMRIWLLSHPDILTGPAQSTVIAGAGGKDNDFYGDGGGGPIVAKGVHGNPADQGSTGANFYNEMPTKMFSGPFIVRAEYVPNAGDHVLLDFGVERQYNDIFSFMIDDVKKILGRVPYVGDVIERFDGKIMELMTSVETQPETWEWLYQTCTATNTNKDYSMFFDGRVMQIDPATFKS